MKPRAVILTLAMCATTTSMGACFRPTLICVQCGANDVCPDGMSCQQGFCRENPGDQCMAPPAPPDSGSDASSTCGDACCIGGSCFVLPPTIRDGLLLWADRTSLPGPGLDVQAWLDRSGHGHDITAVNPTKPTVQLDAVGRYASIDDKNMVLAVQDGPAFRFDGSDFTIMVLALARGGALGGCLFQHGPATRPRHTIYMLTNMTDTPGVPAPPEALFNRAYLRLTNDDAVDASPIPKIVVSTNSSIPDQMHLFVARRIGLNLQFRIDGVIQGQAPMDFDITSELPMSIGACAVDPIGVPDTAFRGKLAAVIVVRGALDDQPLADLEAFVTQTMGTPPAP